MAKQEKRAGEWAASGIVVGLGGLVSIQGDENLHWQMDPERAKWKNPPEDLIEQFTALWQAKTSAIVAFAQKWGPLRIDQDGREPEAIREGSEPLEWWRYLSRRAYAVFRLSVDLESGAPGAAEDWCLISSDGQSNNKSAHRFGLGDHHRWEFSEHIRRFSGYPDSASYAKATIAGEVSQWLRQFTVTPSVMWDEHLDWHITMSYGGRMLAAVAMQLALKVSHGERHFICSGCGRTYKREPGKRRPNAGHANFCSICAPPEERGAAQRAAEKRYRENRREAVKLAAAGVSVREIANKLNRTTSVVRGWISPNRSAQNG